MITIHERYFNIDTHTDRHALYGKIALCVALHGNNIHYLIYHMHAGASKDREDAYVIRQWRAGGRVYNKLYP